MEQLISGFVNFTVVPMANLIGWMASTGVLAVIFAVLWVALGAGIVLSQGTVDEAWRWIGSLPLALQLVAWLLFLPVMAGMWIWESAWPLVVRAILVLGLAGWNILVMIPRAAKP